MTSKHSGSKTLSKKTQRSGSDQRPEIAMRGEEPAEGTIRVWADDPADDLFAERPLPDPASKPLAFDFPQPAPASSGNAPGSEGFRYWTAAEALRRGANFWAAIIGTSNWQVGESLTVLLDEGEDLNAYYDRRALNFFHGPGADGPVYSGESPDILCHEMGHAILDTIKPDLWNAAFQEVAAFHESFADMSAILSAIQLPEMRMAVLKDTNGHLYYNSRLSRLAEALGAAIRVRFPDAVDGDCLRNAVNSFSYHDPIGLPSRSPASQLSSEPHSFSRVFTGAFFEGLAGFLATKAMGSSSPSEGQLLSVSEEMARILVTAIRGASVVSNFYAQVAAAMVEASAGINTSYPDVLRGVFVRRGILSFQTASQRQFAVASLADIPPVMEKIALPASNYGFGELQILVHAPSRTRRFSASSADPSFGAINAQSSEVSARAFLEDLFQRGHVDVSEVAESAMSMAPHRSFKTHRLVRADDGVTLERRCFDCGLRL